jgi:hypothetical protein
MARRAKPLTEDGEDVTEFMPYNGGVVFSRNPLYWEECLQETTRRRAENEWRDCQNVMAVIARSGRFNFLELPPEYNYSPSRASEDVSNKKVLHFKGNRKQLMYRDAFGIRTGVRLGDYRPLPASVA